MSRNREQDLKDIAFIRNYVISVIACGVKMGQEGADSIKPSLQQLSETEAKIIDIMDKR